ncbi:hypothetical protein DID88_000123 [Monilinia fructigena]|uniref:Uncharacterized protein n=1 Tax=Monilinia fructigena TaxID=38457 RepID=A0A395IJ72_9HELO|nr:hypothetical protein DID88_000123 [Monilinia fructigena]
MENAKNAVYDSEAQWATETNMQKAEFSNLAHSRTPTDPAATATCQSTRCHVAETTKQYAGEYAHKAQEIIGSARSRSGSPIASRVTSPTIKTNGIKEDFPVAPKEEFKPAATAPGEELLADA